MCRIPSSLMGASILVGILGWGHPARAQEEPADEAEPPDAAAGGVAIIRPAPQPRRLVLTDEQIEQWVFGPGGAKGARESLEARLHDEIQAIDSITALTPAQKRKLEVAGRGDIKHRLDRVRDRMAVFDRGPVDPLRVRGLLLELQPLRGEFSANLFGPNSLFAKTLANTLTPEQRARHDEMDRLTSYRTRVQWVVFPLDRYLRLSQDQHQRFVALIVEETRPPRKYGELDDEAVFFQVGRLPEARLRSIFNDSQWRLLRTRLDRARRMEPLLIEKGYVP